MRVAWVVLGAVCLHAGDERGVRPELPPAVRPVVELARAASAELFADTVVRLVQAGRIPQREMQIQLLEEAFAVAAGAAEPVRLMAIPPTPPDTRALYRGRAGELRLDALSLRSRILQELLTVDRVRARELFEAIPHPALDARPCSDPLVADIGAYYEIAAAVAQSSFTAAEKEKEAHVQFLTAVLAGARSPGEIDAFARAVQSVGLQASEWELVLAALASKLETVGPDYRTFALSFTQLQGEIGGLVALGSANGVRTDGLTGAFRKYVTAQLGASRCAPDFGPALEDILTVPPLSGDDMKPAKRGDSFTVDPYFQSDDSRRIGDALNRLRFAPGGESPSEGERATAEWRNTLADFLRDFKGWNPPGAEIDAFHQRMTVLDAVLQILPPGGDRDRMIGLAVSYLVSDVERQNPAEWLWQLKKLLRDAGGDAPKMLQQFRASNDSGLVLFASLN
jgi:hypothetical protein